MNRNCDRPNAPRLARLAHLRVDAVLDSIPSGCVLLMNRYSDSPGVPMDGYPVSRRPIMRHRSLRPHRAVIPLLVLSLSSLALPQVHIDRFERVPRLSYPTVGMLQDRHGFLWIGTPSRLLRYDGQTTRELYGDSLRWWQATGIAGGRHDFICLYASINHLLFFNISNSSTRLMSLKEPESGLDYRISCVMEDAQGEFWIGSGDGDVLRISPPDTLVEHIISREARGMAGDSPGVRCIAQDSLGNVWIARGSDLLMLRPENEGRESARVTHNGVRGLPPGEVIGLHTGPDGRLWVVFMNGSVGWINHGDSEFFSIEPRPPFPTAAELRSLAVDPRGNLWLGCYTRGLHRWNAQAGRWESYAFGANVTAYPDPILLPGICVDRTGTIWASTVRRGMLRYSPVPTGFHSYLAGAGTGPRLSGADVACALVDRQGVLWVGRVSGGIEYLEPGKTRFGRLLHDPENPRTLGSNYVVSICERDNGELWFGTAGSGVNVLDRRMKTFRHPIFDPRTQTFSHPDPKPDWVAPGYHTVTALYEDRQGTMWVGHYLGIDTVDPGTGIFQPVLRWSKDSLGLVGSVTCFREDDRGSIWIGTAGRGLLRMGPSRSDTTWYRHDAGTGTSLPSDWVLSVFQDREGRLWIGSTGGLSLFDYRSGTFQNNIRDLPMPIEAVEAGPPYRHAHLIIRGILQDRRGRIWVSFSGGVARFDPEERRFRSYGPREGSIRIDGNRGAFFITREGVIYSGGSGGIIYFDPDSVIDEPFIPQMAITEFRVGERALLVPPGASPYYSLSHTENSALFRFAMLDYRMPSENRCVYMLEGWDRGWLPAREPSAAYMNLQPGTYTFRVRGLTSDGYSSASESSLTFTISPPFWRTWWFGGLVLTMLGSALYALHRNRMARALAMERLRLRIADDLHDDIGSELSAVALESDLAARRLPAKDPRRRRMSAIAASVRGAAEDLRDVVWIVNPEQDKIRDLITRMRSVASKMLPGVEVRFREGTGLRGISLEMEFKRHVFLMYKEMLHNIVKHAQATLVDVELELREEILRLCVTDNGVGFDASAGTEGHGLGSLRSRGERIGGTVTIESTQGSGTRICCEARIRRL